MGTRCAATIIIAALAGLCMGSVARTVCFTERILTDSSEDSRTPGMFRPSTAPAVKLIFEMDAVSRRAQLRRLYWPGSLIRYPNPSYDRRRIYSYYLHLFGDHEDTHFVRYISDFGWNRALDQIPGVVVR